MDVQSGASKGVGANGLSGAPSGAGVVAAVSGCDGGPVPAPFAPASVKEYEVSGVSGPIVQLSIGVRAVVVAEVEAIGLQSTFAREKAEKAEVESEEVAAAAMYRFGFWPRERGSRIRTTKESHLAADTTAPLTLSGLIVSGGGGGRGGNGGGGGWIRGGGGGVMAPHVTAAVVSFPVAVN